MKKKSNLWNSSNVLEMFFLLLALGGAVAFLLGFWSQGIGLLILLFLNWLIIQVV
jgi:hypothetical protein